MARRQLPAPAELAAVHRRSPLAVTASLLAAACACPPAPLDLPPVELRIIYTQAATGTEDKVAQEEAHGLRVDCRLLAVRRPPIGDAIDPQAAWITAAAGQPFRVASALPAGTLWLGPAVADDWLTTLGSTAPGDTLLLGAAHAVVADELTTSVVDPTAGAPRLQFARDGMQVTVTVIGDATATAPEERVTIAESIPRARSVALFVPRPTTVPTSVAGHVYILCHEGLAPNDDVAAAIAAATSTPSNGEASLAANRPWQLALDAVGEHNRRPALLALARQLDLPRCIDVILAADERALIDITQRLSPLDEDDASIAWQFECAVWQALMPRLAHDELTPGLHASALRHLGAVAKDTSALQLQMTACADARTFSLALRSENLLALNDRDAAMRVRAFDWLTQAGVTVPDYEPLAPPSARRAALRRYNRTVERG